MILLEKSRKMLNPCFGNTPKQLMCLTNIENSLRTWDGFLRIVITSFLRNPFVSCYPLEIVEVITSHTAQSLSSLSPDFALSRQRLTNAIGTFLQEPIESEP